jgi:hypothetical protein
VSGYFAHRRHALLVRYSGQQIKRLLQGTGHLERLGAR